MAQPWHTGQIFQKQKLFHFIRLPNCAATGNTGTSIAKPGAESSLKKGSTDMTSIRTSHLITAFFITVSALSTGLMVLVLSLASSGCAI